MHLDRGINDRRADLLDIHQMIFFALFASLRLQIKLKISLIISYSAQYLTPS